jgi:hypothetical protein
MLQRSKKKLHNIQQQRPPSVKSAKKATEMFVKELSGSNIMHGDILHDVIS